MSERKFSVGDRVRICCDDREFNGLETRIASGLVRSEVYGCEGYELEIMCNGVPLHSEAKYLVPIYDGHEKTSWSDCVWKPAGVIS